MADRTEGINAQLRAERERCARICQRLAEGATLIVSVALLEAAAEIRGADVRAPCSLCGYQHGHAIGCANNPVDIALASGVDACEAPSICLSPDGKPNHCVLWKCHEAKTCARGVAEGRHQTFSRKDADAPMGGVNE